MNIKTWQHRVKVNGEWEGDAMKLEIGELRSELERLKAQPVQPALTDAITLPRYLVREWEVRLRSNLLESFANELAHELRTGGAG